MDKKNNKGYIREEALAMSRRILERSKTYDLLSLVSEDGDDEIICIDRIVHVTNDIEIYVFWRYYNGMLITEDPSYGPYVRLSQVRSIQELSWENLETFRSMVMGNAMTVLVSSSELDEEERLNAMMEHNTAEIPDKWSVIARTALTVMTKNTKNKLKKCLYKTIIKLLK